MKSTLILGYGNPDREDDGVAWHILAGIARRLHRPVPDDFSEDFSSQGSPDLLFVLQLTPELAETVAQYDRVCLIDAHTGNIEEEVRLAKIEPQYQASPFTHHLTPQTLLNFTQNLYGAQPEMILVSVRGYQFGFINALSDKTAALSRMAEQKIWEWLNK